MKDKTNEREIAVRLLISVTGANAYGNIELRKALRGLSGVSAGFITELVNGVVRNLIYIDHVISLYSKTPVNRIKTPILSILRAGVYQIFFMDRVPDSAACNEAVKLAKDMGFNGLAGFVNGVLRSVARNRNNIQLPDAMQNPAGYLSLKYSYPEWLIRRFTDELSADELHEMLEANSRPPDVEICVNTMRTDINALSDILRAEGIIVSSGKLCSNALHLSGVPDISKLDSFKKGLFHVMSESSMMAVDALQVEPGQTVLDICAAPGGKSFYAAVLTGETGKVYSRDIHEHRLKLIEDGASRLGLNSIRPELADGTVKDSSMICIADRLLIDAPCSGLGLIRKKPDIKYSKTETDIQTLAALQKKILSACHGYLKPGGLMVYSTCTLTYEENVSNMQWFMENFDYTPEALEGMTGDGFIKLVPGINVTDGFFIARMRKK